MNHEQHFNCSIITVNFKLKKSLKLFRYEVRLSSFDKTRSKLLLAEATHKCDNILVYTSTTVMCPLQAHLTSDPAFIRELLTTVETLICIIVIFKIGAVPYLLPFLGHCYLFYS